MNHIDWDYETSCYSGARAVHTLPNQKGVGARKISPFQGDLLLQSEETPEDNLFGNLLQVDRWKQPILSYPLVYLDIETTSLGSYEKGNRIVSVAACRVEPTGEVKGPHERLVNPRKPIPWQTSQIHGIYDHHVKKAPPFPFVAKRLAAFCQDGVLIAHNGKRCDDPMLRAEFAAAKVSYPFICLIDTLPISRKLWPKRKHGLVPLAKSLELEYGKAHSATGDVITLMSLFRAILDKMGRKTPLRQLQMGRVS